LILVDTSVWVDHLRSGDDRLARLLNNAAVLTHPFIIGEISLGNLHRRDIILSALSGLPVAAAANDAEVLHFIGWHALFGRGIGYIDAHLLAAVQLTAGTKLWTRDRKLLRIAVELGVNEDQSSWVSAARATRV
jgi:predicted nucleic acid-binding protein